MIKKIRELLPRKKKTPEGLGIHVGRDTLTIVRAAKLPAKTEVRQLYSEPLPRLPTVWPQDLVAEALHAAKKSIDLKAEEARITLTSDLAPSHFLVMPPMKGEQLRDALKLQIQNKSDNTTAELSYQFHVLEKRRERCRVFVPSIPTERLRQILGSFIEVNCQIDSMEVEGVSFANLLVHAQVSENAPVAVLLIGRSWGEIFIFRRGKVVLSRSVSKLDADAGSTDGATSAGATAVELDLNDDNEGMDATHLGHLVRETNKTLDYFEIELLSPAVEHLFVAGEGSDAPGLTGFLQDQLKLHVSALDTGDGIEDTTGEYEPVLHGLAVAAVMGGSAE